MARAGPGRVSSLPVRDDPHDATFVRACLDRARSGPATVRETLRGLSEEDARRKPGVGKLAIIEHLQHMLEMERGVFGVRIRRVLAEDNPRLEPVNQEHLVDESQIGDRPWSEIVDAWAEFREGNVAVVEGTTEAQWRRPARHPDLGDGATFADVVARWSRHDTDHLRQLDILARNCRERNLPT